MSKWFATRFIVSVLLLQLSACSYFQTASLEPIKSANDYRQYQLLTLDNQLRVLLISDPLAERAAASLDIGVGSRQDPEDSQGLAHFLEHMLFLGTQKYPEADSYQAFMNAHGGSHNAYTSFEHTNYFFDIDPAALDQALDRFSQFFIAPLFTEQYVEREKNAVHSEYTSKLKDDHRKASDVFKAIINPQHPFSKFSVGNLATLSSKQQGALRQELLTFYQQYYSANLMTLVVTGRESLAELKAMVTPKFNVVANRKVAIPPIVEPLFIPDSLPMKVAISPEKEQRLLTLNFSVADSNPYYRQKPLEYLGNILGHEGEGSLLSYLKQHNWAKGITAGTELNYQGGGVFAIRVELTEKGLSNQNAVIMSVFQLINRIREQGVQRWLFNEQAQVAQMQFRYQDIVPSSDYSRRLASAMHDYPAADILQGVYLMSDFDATLINRYLSEFTPDKLLITVMAPNVDVDQTSPYYNTAYSVRPIAKAVLAQWRDAGLNDSLQLPAANPFLARDLSLHNADQAVNDNPQLIIDKPGFKLWFKDDEQFNVPKGSVFLTIRSEMANHSVNDAVLQRLWVAMLNEQLNEYSYPALIAGLHYSLSSHLRGISVNVSGFTDKQLLLYEQIQSTLLKPEFPASRFSRVKSDLLRRLENANKEQPYAMQMSDLSELLFHHRYSSEAQRKALSNVTIEQLRDFSTRFFQQVDLSALVYGNYSQAYADQFGASMYSAFLAGGVAKLASKDSLQVAISQLTEGDSAYRVDSYYDDAALLYYIQSARLDKTARVSLAIAAQLYRSEFYSNLRTEKQLGYIVSSGVYPVYDVPGLYFVVQSPVAGVARLKSEIESFIEAKGQALDTLTEQQFIQARDVIVQHLSQLPTSLNEQAERYWSDINYHYFGFDSKEQLIAALQQLDSLSWKQNVKASLFDSSRRGLWLYSPGKFNEPVDMSASEIKDVEAYKANHDALYFQ